MLLPMGEKVPKRVDTKAGGAPDGYRCTSWYIHLSSWSCWALPRRVASVCLNRAAHVTTISSHLIVCGTYSVHDTDAVSGRHAPLFRSCAASWSALRVCSSRDSACKTVHDSIRVSPWGDNAVIGVWYVRLLLLAGALEGVELDGKLMFS